MAANPETTVPLMVGTVLPAPEGKLIVRARSRGWLHVMDEGGNAREPLTIKQGARLLMSADNPPPTHLSSMDSPKGSHRQLSRNSPTRTTTSASSARASP
jgi:hypothetical protein